MNLIGQKFNRLLVLEKTNQRNNGSIVWKCQCDCGNITYVSTRSLRSNNTKSCGCLNIEQRQKRINKYNKEHETLFVNMQINELTLLEKTDCRQNDDIVWKCQCSCGNICYIKSSNLKKQKTCGCCNYKAINYKDITNQKFGKLTALKPTEKRIRNNVIWECKCDCGNICFKSATHLIRGDVQSCGCLKSKGEEKIIQILLNNNIQFETQKTFKDCKYNNHLLFFDFFVNNSYIIEYDGIQHFQQTGWEDLNIIQKRDKEKNNWCKKNNISIIRIPYTRLNKLCLEDLLLKTSQFVL